MADNQWAHQLIDEMLSKNFYGELVLMAKAGKVHKISQRQDFIAPEFIPVRAAKQSGKISIGAAEKSY